MYKVQFSPRSREDLMRIRKHIAEEFGKKISEEVLRKIISKIKNFEEFPLMGRPLSNLIDIPTDYMYIVIEKNYVFYRVEDRFVKVIRILNTRQDFMRILFDIDEKNDM